LYVWCASSPNLGYKEDRNQQWLPLLSVTHKHFSTLLMKNSVLLNRAHYMTSLGKKWEASEMGCPFKVIYEQMVLKVTEEMYVWNYRFWGTCQGEQSGIQEQSGKVRGPD
jgi:dihydrofolate reductase